MEVAFDSLDIFPPSQQPLVLFPGRAEIAKGEVLGQCPGVGAARLTLGGGLGWLSGLHGAACDNLLSADGRELV